MSITQPLTGRWSRTGILLVLWAALGLAAVSQFYFLRIDMGQRASLREAFLVRPVLDWYLWLVFIPVIVLVARRFSFERPYWPLSLVAHVAAMTVLGLAHRELSVWLLAHVHVGRGFPEAFPPGGPRPGPRGPFHLFRTVGAYGVLVGMYYFLDYYGKYREREVKAAELEGALAKAELAALQMQLQPHFLFNTLHVIGVLMHTEPDTAHRMIAQLSDLLRISLDSMTQPEIPLRQELEFVQRYLAIQQVRFKDRLDVRYEISPEVLEARVPNLLLQPLVENAIDHGIAPRAGAGAIEIRAVRNGATLEITVRNDGRPLRQPPAGSEASGIGLQNTRRRLEGLYGPKARLELRNAASGGVEAFLTLPLRRMPGEREDGSDA